METNCSVINSLYSALKSKDFERLKFFYSEQLHFSDEVFDALNYTQTLSMWTMLLSRSKDIFIEFGEVECSNQIGSAVWKAHYIFTPTGRKVINEIHARFEFKDGKIVHHRDYFNFYRWARQAFGWKGILLGWMPFFKSKVQRNAKKSLDNYMNKIR